MQRLTWITLAFIAIGNAEAQWWTQPITGVPTFKSNGTLLNNYPALLILDGIIPESVKAEARERLASFVGNRPIVCINKGYTALNLVLVTCSLEEQDLSEWLIAQKLATRGTVGSFKVVPSVNIIPPSLSNSFFATCADARAKGAVPLRRGQPGYRSELDADGDGIACE